MGAECGVTLDDTQRHMVSKAKCGKQGTHTREQPGIGYESLSRGDYLFKGGGSTARYQASDLQKDEKLIREGRQIAPQ